MAVVNNIATEIGDVLYIKTEVPVLGLIALIDFTDIVLFETSIRFFNREFRYALDGVNYTPWIPLTKAALEAIPVDPKSIFVVEYKYTRAGIDPSGELDFVQVQLQGDFEPISCGPTYKNSIFAETIGDCVDVSILEWALNVLEKLYKVGIVPKYIERGKNPTEDVDFIRFWYSITTFFAYFVAFARKFETFDSIESLLKDYLRQKGLYFSESDEQYSDLLYILHNSWNEFRKRGSLAIIKEKGTTGVRGELLRLISKKDSDEFIFALSKAEDLNWWLNNASPMYGGVSKYKYLNKAYEDTQKITKTNYPLLSDPKVSVITDGGVDVLKITTTTASTIAGIGADYTTFDFTTFDFSKYGIVVSTNFDYEISFLIKQPNTLGSVISFGVLGFDKNNTQLDLRKVTDGSFENFFFKRKGLIRNDTYFEIKGYVFNKGQLAIVGTDSILDIGFGNHLVFSSHIAKIVPILVTDTPGGFSGDSSVYIKDFKITPLNTKDAGFLGAQNLIRGWLKNNNQALSTIQLEEIIREKMVPYNSFLAFNWEQEIADANVAASLDAFINNKVNISAPGANDGSIDITVTGGVAPYTYAWSKTGGGFTATTQDVSALVPGIYSVTIQDSSLVTQTKILTNIAIVEPPISELFVTVASITNASIYGADNGAITINIVGGKLPYSIVWSNGALTQNINHLLAGNYSVLVQDSSPTPQQKQILNIPVTQPPADTLQIFVVSISPVVSVGGAQGAITISVIGGVLPLTFAWTKLSSGYTASTQNISGLTEGYYTVVVSDSVGQVKSLINIQVPNITLSASITSTSPSTIGGVNGTANLNIVGGLAPLTITWTKNGVAYPAGTGLTALTGLGAGTYQATVIDSLSPTPQTVVASTVLTDPACTITNFNYILSQPSTGVASDGQITISSITGGVGPYTYKLGAGAYQSSNIFTGLPEGTYSVTVKDSVGCTYSISGIILNSVNRITAFLADSSNSNIGVRFQTKMSLYQVDFNAPLDTPDSVQLTLQLNASVSNVGYSGAASSAISSVEVFKNGLSLGIITATHSGVSGSDSQSTSIVTTVTYTDVITVRLISEADCDSPSTSANANASFYCSGVSIVSGTPDPVNNIGTKTLSAAAVVS